MSDPVLNVSGLSITIDGRAVVDRLSFELGAGEVLALVGESGCGKTKTAEALLGLVPGELGRTRADSMRLGDTELTALDAAGWRSIRGREISMVFQEPMTALDPVFTAGQQLSRQFRRHRRYSGARAREAALEILGRVGIADTARVFGSYPHELSGGMRQRVVIAMAMACRPRVLVADEPTTALDVTTQAQVLEQLLDLGKETGTGILLITHDLGVVAQYCDRAVVMREGKAVEEGAVDALFSNPRHDYTKQLIAAARDVSP